MAAAMVANLGEKTGKNIAEWKAILSKTGLEKHGEMVKFLKSEYSIGHGFANLIVHEFRSEGSEAPTDPIAAIYSGKKEHLRPVHDKILAAIKKFGKDVELAPKKTYVSLRRSKQFATVGPGTNTAIDIGVNLKDVAASPRLKEVKGGMCSHKVRISDAGECDDELLGWLKRAYEGA